MPVAARLPSPMDCHPFALRLARGAALSPQDRSLLEGLPIRRRKRLGPREDLFSEGASPRSLFLLLEGWAYRYKQLEDGRRQIVSLIFPGEMTSFALGETLATDHSITAATPIEIAEVPRDALAALALRSPGIANALAWDAMAALSIQREWTISLGQRTAFERIGHLLCEIFVRLSAIRLTRMRSCDFPLTQAEVADATGLSVVHANRTLQELRATGLIVLKDRVLTIPSLPSLAAASLFHPAYLYIGAETGREILV